MIFLSLDESYCIDFLTILLVKSKNCDGDKLLYIKSQIKFYENSIREQISDDLFEKICKSKEYKKLLEANMDLFDIIDKCKKYEVPARLVDRLNFVRATLKNEIQKKFFGKPATELKIGYENK